MVDQLSLAVNGRENQLRSKLAAFPLPAHAGGNGNGHGNGDKAAGQLTVAIVGMGYVGLPTAITLAPHCRQVTGIDVSNERLRAVASGSADLPAAEAQRLSSALAGGKLRLTADPAAIGEADAVIICVPTPVDTNHMPELSALHGACADVVAHAKAGQTIILTSTTYVGTTAELLAAPLTRRGLAPGSDIFVGFSPERIDPGNPDHLHEETPRVVGGVTAECAARAAGIISLLTPEVYVVSAAEAAAATKLYENIFRAVSLALANEFADACGVLQLDPIEVTLAAATKPYGFLATFPGPGVGGHCIPCDPHYLLWQLGTQGHSSPLIEQAMRSIRKRPERVVERAGEVLAADGSELAGARVLVVGASYKPGVRDLRESSAVPMIASLQRKGADVHYFDPLVPDLKLPDGAVLRSEADPDTEWDLVIVHTLHPGVDHSWASKSRVLDATYRFDSAAVRAVV
jgi:UDP-N-acetyl-D-glucosamine dehydrogenase